MTKILKFIFIGFGITLGIAVFFIAFSNRQIVVSLDENYSNNLPSEPTFENATSSAVNKSPIQTNLEPKTISSKNPVKSITDPIINKISDIPKEVTPISFENLVNSSMIQLYCGNIDFEKIFFSNISRGTGVIIGEDGTILTNRHLVYDENLREIKNDCYVLKSPFPNEQSQNPKIYYKAEILKYPAIERFSDFFSKDKYYNDFAILKIVSRPESNSKLNSILGFDFALPEDYAIVERGGGKFNYFPIDWDYQPKDGDVLVTLGYGVDASHTAKQVTSTIGKLGGNINISGNSAPQILLVESNATAGFSGGALVNLQTKGLVGLISWITAGDIAGKYTVAIFRDFLRDMMMVDINFDLKSI